MEKAEHLARMIARRPNPSREQLIKHVEFAAEFGRIPNFEPYGRKMSFISYFMLDIIIPFLLLVAIIIFGIMYLLYRLVKKYVLRRGQKEPEKVKKQWGLVMRLSLLKKGRVTAFLILILHSLLWTS